jgi:diaminopimelate epimerase
MRWPFAKFVGCGNDFILFDNRHGNFPLSQPGLIKWLCHRQEGIGADGILLLENSMLADFRMRIFNSNGSEAEMCGNGLRCFVKWLADQGLQRQIYRIEVMHRILTALLVKNTVCIEMGKPVNSQWNIPLSFENQLLNVHHLDTGVPHTILFVKDLTHIKFIELGAYIRNHSRWMPKGTNVNLAQQTGPQTFKIRTYERGVEGETLGCGTGATAVALAAAYQYHLSSPIIIQTSSGEELSIEFLQQEQDFSNVTLTGPVQGIFQGEIDLCITRKELEYRRLSVIQEI